MRDPVEIIQELVDSYDWVGTGSDDPQGRAEAEAAWNRIKSQVTFPAPIDNGWKSTDKITRGDKVYDIVAISRVCHIDVAKGMMALMAARRDDEALWNRMFKFYDFMEIMGRIHYKPGWYIRVGVEAGMPERMWMQIGVTEEAEISWDMVAGKKVPWRGAKHYLSEHMCRNEIVTNAFHAFERAELHEAKEWFRYAPAGKKPRAIFNPHLDPDALAVTASKAANFDTRENAMTMDDPA